VTRTEPTAAIAERLTDGLRTGTLLDFIPETSGGEVLDESEMRGWDDGHDVDASLVRGLLLRHGLEGEHPDPRGLQVRGARIRGRLDLDLVETTVALELIDCLLDGGVTAAQAHLPVLRLQRCRLGHPDEPAFAADLVRVDGDLDLDGIVISARSTAGAVQLRRARIGRRLTLRGASLRNASGPALAADGLRTEDSVLLDLGFTAEGAGSGGAVQLFSARVGGRLSLRGASLRNASGPALLADGLQTGPAAFLDLGFTAEGAGSGGAVRLVSARVGGQLSLRGASLRNASGPALLADNLQTESMAQLDKGFAAEGAGDDGAVKLHGARIGDDLSLRGASLRNTSGSALLAPRVQVGGDAFLDQGFTAESAGITGTVHFPAAQVNGDLSLRGASLRNASGPALVANGVQIGGGAFLNQGFTAESVGITGTVHFPAAQVNGDLSLRGASLRNASGPALVANGVQIGGDAFLDQGFTAESAEANSAIMLVGARVAGRLLLRGGAPRHRWAIEGFTYSGVPRLAAAGNRDAWLEFLQAGTPHYAAQPYQHLAAAYRAEGHDSDVRRILIAQRRDQIARGGLSRADRWWGRTTGVLLGYGYQPWRALLYLAGVLALSVGLAVSLGGLGGLARTGSPPTGASSLEAAAAPVAGMPCTFIQTIGRGLDLGTPFLPAAPAVAGSCQPTTAPAGDELAVGPWTVHAGEAFTVVRWVLQLIAWALAALFIAGFTGIVRKT
jgi:hypothetical protein